MTRDWLRLVAYALCIPALVGAVLAIVAPDEISLILAWLLIPPLVTGLVLGTRFFPFGFTAAHSERMHDAWRDNARDAAIVGLAYLAGGIITALVIQLADPDAVVFALAFGVAVIASVAVLTGSALAVLTLLPLVDLGHALLRRANGKPVDRVRVAAAVLLLSVVAFAVLVVLVTGDGGGGRVTLWLAITLLFTLAPTDDAALHSVPLVWAARLALLVVIASAVAVGALARRTRRARR